MHFYDLNIMGDKMPQDGHQSSSGPMYDCPVYIMINFYVFTQCEEL